MPKPLRFSANVVADLQKGIDWYDRISFPLGNRFRTAVRAQFREIAAQARQRCTGSRVLSTNVPLVRSEMPDSPPAKKLNC